MRLIQIYHNHIKPNTPKNQNQKKVPVERLSPYYTPLPLNLANNNNKQQQQHVSLPFWPLLRPYASDLVPM